MQMQINCLKIIQHVREGKAERREFSFRSQEG